METDFYLKCDKLDNLPPANKANWLFELDLQCRILPQGASLLQVGCMDGTRILEILKVRPDLQVTGLDIEKRFLDMAEQNLRQAGLKASLIEADITTFTASTRYEYVTCLNNTLSYIPDTGKAIQSMKDAGQTVFVSVYGEKFDEAAAKAYFGSLGRAVLKADEKFFTVEDFGEIRRFIREDVLRWGGEVTETPLGYFSTFSA